MAEHFIPPSLGIDLDATSTDQLFQLGTIVSGSDSSGSYSAEYMYVKSDANISQYAACKIDDDYTIQELTDTVAGVEPTAVGIPQIAMDGSATAVYGWVVISGSGTVEAATTVAADVKLYTTTTAGRIDDASTNQALIQGVKLTAAASGNTGTFFAVARMKCNSQD